MQYLKPTCLLLAPVLLVVVVGCAGPTVDAEPTQESVPTMPPLEPSAQPATPTKTPTETPIAKSTDANQTQDWCVGSEIHPIGQQIADNFEVPYEQVIAWHCEENDFEDILLALETNELSGEPVETILEMRAKDRSWEQIWKELGITDSTD